MHCKTYDKNKYVHIMFKEKFTNSFVDFINTYFDKNQHEFYIINQECIGGEIPNEKNVFVVDNKNDTYFVAARDNAKVIYLHFFKNIITPQMLGNKKKILKKTVWITWGGDIYDYRKNSKTLLGKLKIIYKRYYTKQFKCIAVLAEDDYKYAKKYYKVKDEHYMVSYIGDKGQKLQKEIAGMKKDDHDEIRILIGNSATETCKHYEILNILKRFENENIKIYLPLSYGNLKYGEEVEQKAREIFGEKVIILKDYMDYADYMRILRNMDIGIFANDRQQAMGNINMLLMSGVKVFLNPVSSMYKLYSERDFIFYDYNNLFTCSYDQMINFDDETKCHNVAIGENFDSVKLSIKLWNNLFENTR